MFLGLTFAFISPVFGDELKKVDPLIRGMVDGAITAVHNNELNTDEKVEKVMEVLTPVFDFPLMAKLTLGKKNWPKFSKKQREIFTDLFVTQLQDSYLGNLEMWSNEELTCDPPVYKGKKVHMMMHVNNKEDSIEILYKLYFKKKTNEWRIYDIEIKGVSIVKSYSMQYDQVLQNETAETLLQKIKERIEQNKNEDDSPEKEERSPEQE